MLTGTFEYRDEAQRVAIEQAGSGLVEGTIKPRVNLRLKRTGARWQATGVGPVVEMLAMSDTPEWAEYWTTRAA